MFRGYKSVFLILLCAACKMDPTSDEVADNVSIPFGDSLVLVKSDPIELEVDSLTANYSSVIQTFTQDTTEMLAFMQGSIIHVYNLDSKRKITSIEIDEEAEGLGRLTGFKIKNLDSIIVTNRHEAHFIDSNGKKFLSLDLTRRDLFPSGFSFGTGDVLFVEDKVHFITVPEINPLDYTTMESLEQAVVLWNYKNDSLSKHLKYPDDIIEKVFPFQMTLRPIATYNSNKKLYAYSFGALHEIILSNLNGYLESKVAMSQKFPKIEETTINVVSDSRQREKYYRTTPSYLHILYDQYRNVYYRVVMQPVTLEEFNDRNWAKDPYVIILDEDFNHVGESDLGSGISVDNILVSKEGLIVLNHTHENENIMQFEVFKLANGKN